MKILDRTWAEKVSPPDRLEFWNVMYWCPEAKELLEVDEKGNKTPSSILTKANKFLDNKCVSQVSPFEWIVSPLEGYNTTTYTILLNGNFSCNCQGFKNNNTCSHIISVKMFKYMNEYNNRRNNEKKLL